MKITSADLDDTRNTAAESRKIRPAATLSWPFIWSPLLATEKMA